MWRIPRATAVGRRLEFRAVGAQEAGSAPAGGRALLSAEQILHNTVRRVHEAAAGGAYGFGKVTSIGRLPGTRYIFAPMMHFEEREEHAGICQSHGWVNSGGMHVYGVHLFAGLPDNKWHGGSSGSLVWHGWVGSPTSGGQGTRMAIHCALGSQCLPDENRTERPSHTSSVGRMSISAPRASLAHGKTKGQAFNARRRTLEASGAGST